MWLIQRELKRKVRKLIDVEKENIKNSLKKEKEGKMIDVRNGDSKRRLQRREKGNM